MIEVHHLSKVFYHRGHRKPQKAVDDVSFQIEQKSTYGLMGESGCGKSTIGRMITRLIPATSGEILYNGVDLLKLSQREMLPYRKKVQILFQHPDTSLDPHMTVLENLREPLLLHKLVNKNQMDDVIREHIVPYGIQSELLKRRTSQVSGGQIQRIVLARVMLMKPDFIVLDEPTSMLDVSVQAQIMELLKNVQEETGVSYLLISHDLDLIRQVSNKIGIMCQGRLLEQGYGKEVLENPQNDYTKRLIQQFHSMRD